MSEIKLALSFGELLVEIHKMKQAQTDTESRCNRLEMIAHHLRFCVECGEMDVRHCWQGLTLWNAAFPDDQLESD